MQKQLHLFMFPLEVFASTRQLNSQLKLRRCGYMLQSAERKQRFTPLQRLNNERHWVTFMVVIYVCMSSGNFSLPHVMAQSTGLFHKKTRYSVSAQGPGVARAWLETKPPDIVIYIRFGTRSFVPILFLTHLLWKYRHDNAYLCKVLAPLTKHQTQLLKGHQIADSFSSQKRKHGFTSPTSSVSQHLPSHQTVVPIGVDSRCFCLWLYNSYVTVVTITFGWPVRFSLLTARVVTCLSVCAEDHGAFLWQIFHLAFLEALREHKHGGVFQRGPVRALFARCTRASSRRFNKLFMLLNFDRFLVFLRNVWK